MMRVLSSQGVPGREMSEWQFGLDFALLFRTWYFLSAVVTNTLHRGSYQLWSEGVRI
jgi:hypothetical protein